LNLNACNLKYEAILGSPVVVFTQKALHCFLTKPVVSALDLASCQVLYLNVPKYKLCVVTIPLCKKYYINYTNMIFILQTNLIYFTFSLESSKPAPTKLYIMPCLCNHNRTFTNMTHDQIIEYLKKETAIQANQTSRSLNKLRSRSDPRTSSFVVGLVGIGTIAGILGIVILWDMPTLVKHFVAALTNIHELLCRPKRVGVATCN